MDNKTDTKISDDSKFEIVEKRKLHDFWALILYIVCFSILLFLTFFFAHNNEERKTKLIEISSTNFPKADQTILNGSKKNDVYTIAISEFFIGDLLKLTITPIFIFIVMLMLAYILTTAFFHMAFILNIITPIIFAGRGLMYSKPIMTIMPFVIMSLVAAAFYAFLFRRIKFVSKPFKMSIRIMWSCLLLFSSLIVLYTFISIGIAYAINTPLTQKLSTGEYSIIGIFCTLVAFWTMYLISMISQVAMSAITAQYLIHDLTGSHLVGSSLKIVLYSLGSACFAALMLAIVSLIKQFVEAQMNNQNREGRSSLVIAILLIILHALISLFEDFIHFLTSWAMTVVALKGCKLTTAMKSVIFDIKSGFLSTIIAGRLMAMLVFSAIVSVFLTLIYGSRIYYLKEVLPNSKLDKYLQTLMEGTSFSKYTKIGSKNYIGIFNPLPIYYFIIVIVCLSGFGMLIQKIMEMIYLIFNENPNIIKRKDIVVYESMEAELNTKAGYCGC